MSLKIYKEYTHNRVKLVTGHAYSFKYAAYANDPSPIVFLISTIRGIHPNTGHQWRLIQGINISYIPRADRKRFIEIWKREMTYTNARPEFSWEKIKRQFPYIQHGIRRYMLKPNYYIRDLREVPTEMYEDIIIKSWSKDFSSAIKRRVAASIKGFFTGWRR